MSRLRKKSAMNLLKMISTRRQFVDGPYGQVHIRVAGQPSDKNPLICLHQSPKSGREFTKFMEQAATDRLIVAIDNPGHGESDIPSTFEDATIPNYARSAWAVIEALGHKKVDLLGNHTGSSVAVEMATQRPKAIEKIVLISSPIYNTAEIAAFRKMFTTVPMDEAGTRFKEMWAKSIKFRGPGVSLQDLAVAYAENFRAGEAYEWGHFAAFDYASEFTQKLSNLDHRIIVLNPGDLIFDATLRAEPYLKNGEIRNYPDWGIGFLTAFTQDAVEAVKAGLD